jgi:hypothetical protein
MGPCPSALGIDPICWRSADSDPSSPSTDERVVDGFTTGRWRVNEAKTGAVLRIETFRRLSNDERSAVEDEGERLIRLLAKERAHSVEISGCR